MSTLARHLYDKGIRLKDPLEENFNQQKPPPAQDTPTDRSDVEESGTKSETTPNMSETKKKIAFDDDGLTSALKKMKVGGPTQTISGGISNPMISGRWETFDHTTDTKQGVAMLRMPVHNASKVKDFSSDWLSLTTLQVTQQWPSFMAQCLTMTALDTYTDDQHNSSRLRRNGKECQEHEES